MENLHKHWRSQKQSGKMRYICHSRNGRGLPRWLSGKEFAEHCRRCKRGGFDSWAGKIPWGRKWLTYSGNLAWEIPWTEELGGAAVHRVAKSQTRLSHCARTEPGRRQQGSETSKRRKASHGKIKKRTNIWSTNVCWAM